MCRIGVHLIGLFKMYIDIDLALYFCISFTYSKRTCHTMHPPKRLCALAISAIFLLSFVYEKASATQYVYPNSQSGYTLWVPDSTLSSSDTLSFNGDTTYALPNGDRFMLVNGGDNSITTLTPSTVTIDMNYAGDIISISALSNATIPSDLSFIGNIGYLGNTSIDMILGFADGTEPKDFYLNGNLSFETNSTNTVRAIQLTEYNINISGDITGQTNNSTQDILGVWSRGNSFSLNHTVSATGSINMTGGDNAVAFRIDSSDDITNYGSISADGTALRINASSKIYNYGTISGGQRAINFTGTSPSAELYMRGGTISGNIELTGASATATMNFDNNATTSINGNILSGVSNISVASGATANFNGAVVTPILTINGTATINQSATASNISNITNSGTFTLAGPTFSGSGTLTNNGSLNITQNSVLTNYNVNTNSSGSVSMSGNKTLNALSYTNSGTQNHSVTNASTYDSLNITGTANLSDCAIQITSNVTEQGVYSWALLTSSGLTTNGATNLVFSPANSLFYVWSHSFSGNSLTVNLEKKDFVNFAYAGTNNNVARVLDAMAKNISNTGQDELVGIFESLNSVGDFNSALHQMLPNQNTSQQSIRLVNTIFSRTESRLAALQNKYITGHQNSNTYAAGDLGVDGGFWISGFGSTAKQSLDGENAGYSAKTAGLLFGIDYTDSSENVFGISAGKSSSNIEEESNPNFSSKISGYHMVAYASRILENYNFTEYLLSWSLNKNKGTRQINISGNNLTTTYSYYSCQIFGKINLGQHFDLTECLTLSPLATLQYGFVNKPSYTETGSAAALYVEQSGGKNLVTVGSGVRLSFYSDNWLLVRARELRAIVTYDALSQNQNTTANFVVGSNNFFLTSSQSRLALKLGVDFEIQIASRINLQLSYEYETRKKFIDHSGILKFRYVL